MGIGGGSFGPWFAAEERLFFGMRRLGLQLAPFVLGAAFVVLVGRGATKERVATMLYTNRIDEMDSVPRALVYLGLILFGAGTAGLIAGLAWPAGQRDFRFAGASGAEFLWQRTVFTVAPCLLGLTLLVGANWLL